MRNTETIVGIERTFRVQWHRKTNIVGSSTIVQIGWLRLESLRPSGCFTVDSLRFAHAVNN